MTTLVEFIFFDGMRIIIYARGWVVSMDYGSTHCSICIDNLLTSALKSAFAIGFGGNILA